MVARYGTGGVSAGRLASALQSVLLTTPFLTPMLLQVPTMLATCNDRLESGPLGGRKCPDSFQRIKIRNRQSSTMDNRQGDVRFPEYWPLLHAFLYTKGNIFECKQ